MELLHSSFDANARKVFQARSSTRPLLVCLDHPGGARRPRMSGDGHFEERAKIIAAIPSQVPRRFDLRSLKALRSVKSVTLFGDAQR